MASRRSRLINTFQQGIRWFHGSNIAQRQTMVEGLPLNYEVAGGGKKVALCMPGALEDFILSSNEYSILLAGTIQSDFGPQMKSLAGKNLTLVCWDPPGYGKSWPPPRQYSLDFLHRDAAIAALLMKTLKYDKYSLLGWSDGGISALILAAAYPQHVDKLVVWGANAYVSHGIRDINKWSQRMRAPLEAIYGTEYFKEAWEGWVDTLLHIYHEKGGDICKGDLAKITCSTLIIHGAKDPVAPLSHGQLVIMDEGKHNIHLRSPEEFNKIVYQFLFKE
ncbi:Valacyclovir hydrolase-like [Homarus americanus]|uniref:Valacyclovir hydrolase-like n=1 Tax=Homarus americanus TaxID=6706 RepID=A0A8J5JIR2_HOMAM|nr:Valacyclovir hydrolase-like [Homarus americanus]